MSRAKNCKCFIYVYSKSIDLILDTKLRRSTSNGFYKNIFIFEANMTSNLYLNAGMGNPWAGQESANKESFCTSNVFDLSFKLNFGAALPIGSTKN